MKKKLLIIVLLLDWCVSYAQINFDSVYSEKRKIENAPVFDAEQYIIVFYTLYNSFIENGVYYLAFQLINETMQVYIDKTEYHNSIYTRELMSCMSSTEYFMGNIRLALEYAKKTEQMCEIANDNSSQCYMELLTKLNEYYRLLGDNKNADETINKAYELLKEKTNGDIWNVSLIKNLHLEGVLNNLGTDCYRKGDYEMAEKYYRVVLKAYEDLPLSVGSHQTVGANLANLLFKQQKYEESIDIVNKFLIPCQDEYLRLYYYQTLTSDYVYLKDTINVMKSLCDFNIRVLFNIASHFTKFSELEREEYWSNISTNTYNFNNWVVYHFRNPTVNIFSFEINSFLRYFSVDYSRLVSHFIEQFGDIALQKQLNDVHHQKENYIFKQYNKEIYYDALSKEQQVLINMGNAIEDSVIHSYLMYETLNNYITDDEFVIHFTDGEYYPTNDDDSPNLSYYTAYLIGRKVGVPLYYFVCPKYQVDSVLWSNDSPELFYSHLYSKDQSKKLYHLFFQQLEQFFNGAHTIYYSTCGKLSFLNFDLFCDDTDSLLCQKYKMVRVSSIYEIPEVKSLDLKSAKTASLYGGIDYKNSSENAVAGNRGIDFANLPNSANEIKNINTILSTANIKTDTLCGTSATEDSFKQLSGHSPDILHVATHGFYLDEESQKPFAQSVNTYSQKEAPMVLSGLALSGADIKWKGNFEDVNSEDGILTAYEISQLDLSNTRLAVLSACETAKGRIFPVDGVFGLQRAFKQAGAGAILMSLWKVNDAATSLFMQHFYKSLIQTGDRHKALNFARNEVKKDFPDPYYWAAWVLLD